ncbi:class I SAM-dependent methyltransferase [Shewanella sp.]|uniref:class I SAM-dependent methyltransferase n=1 Tax=Shewanella sp. TaxID=50422 RepID=UPI00356AE15C
MTLPHSALLSRFETVLSNDSESCVLDLACGTGRNGRWFLQRGHRVSFLDIHTASLEAEFATNPNATIIRQDLESGEVNCLGSFDLVLVFNYLHRPLWPLIKQTVKPGGILVYQTFTWQQAKLGRPSNPAFLLEENELTTVFAGWHQLYYGEEVPEPITGNGAFKAGIICRKPME